MISKKDKKILIITFVFVAVFVAFYVFQSLYFTATGSMKTEYALEASEKLIIETKGFCVRDEYRTYNNSVISFFYRDGNKFYVPILSDCENVARNEAVAYCFDSENHAASYTKRVELKNRINDAKNMKSQGEIEYADVPRLNTLIYSSVINYADSLSKGNIVKSEELKNDILSRITSRQIATGERIDFDSKISQYQDEYNSLYTNSNFEKVRSPIAGCFVSRIDGFENTVSFNDVKNKKITSDTAKKVLKSDGQTFENVYGKLVCNFEWYYIFSIPKNEASSLKRNMNLSVNFTSIDIEDIPMSVYYIAEDKNDDYVTVTLKCKYLNKDLVLLRKEDAQIVVKTYSGFKINKKAITYNNEDIPGVYALEGKKIRFSPLNIYYYGDDYVIAGKYYVYKIEKDKNGNEIKVVDEEKTDQYRAIECYDKIIVKGKNLEDGKFID